MNTGDFTDRLKELTELAARNQDTLTIDQLREKLSDLGLDTDKQLRTIQYLMEQGIHFLGMHDLSETEEKKDRIPLTPEEKAYYRSYKESLQPIKDDGPEALWQGLAGDDPMATAALSNYYFHKAADLAVEMNVENILLQDLIQEANVGLLTAMAAPDLAEKGHLWLMNEIRTAITDAIYEQSRISFSDDQLIAKVEKLEKAIREITGDEEETDDRNKLTVGELAVLLDMDVREIHDILKLTGDDVDPGEAE